MAFRTAKPLKNPEYAQLEKISRCVHFDDFDEAISKKMLVPQLLSNSRTKLEQQVLWFAPSQASTEHNFYGNVSFTIKWETVLQKLGPNLYLIDQAIYNARSFTRVVFTRKNYDRILKKVDFDSEDSPMTKSWSGFRHASHCMNKVSWGPHELQIAIEVIDVEARWLYLNCKLVVNDHSNANIASKGRRRRWDKKVANFESYNCFKFNTAQNSECPYKWTADECMRHIKTVLKTVVRVPSCSGRRVEQTFDLPKNNSDHSPIAPAVASPLTGKSFYATQKLSSHAVISQRPHPPRTKSSANQVERTALKDGWLSYISPAATTNQEIPTEMKTAYRLPTSNRIRSELPEKSLLLNYVRGLANPDVPSKFTYPLTAEPAKRTLYPRTGVASTDSAVALPTRAAVSSSTDRAVAFPTRAAVSSSPDRAVALPTRAALSSSTDRAVAFSTRVAVSSSTGRADALPTRVAVSSSTDRADALLTRAAVSSSPDRAVTLPTRVAVSSSTDRDIAFPTRAAVSLGTDRAVALPTRAAVSSSTNRADALPTRAAVSLVTDRAVALPTRAAVSSSTDRAVALPTRAAVSSSTDRAVALTTRAVVSWSTDRAVALPTRVAVSSSTDRADALPTRAAVSLSTDRAVALPTLATVSSSTDRAVTLPTRAAVSLDTDRAVALPTRAEVSLGPVRAAALPTRAPVSSSTDRDVALPTRAAVSSSTDRAVALPTRVAVSLSTDRAVAFFTSAAVSSSKDRAVTLSTRSAVSSSTDHAVALPNRAAISLSTRSDHAVKSTCLLSGRSATEENTAPLQTVNLVKFQPFFWQR
ncbi:cell wall protein AWA1 [Hyalella azteca]|uniref:Cell wall protein AWA1 n=1 Tax=Hyalella azteca TaxID=294128 RepID=A0A8B7PF06_HYAAZ|nr:cell wall protein AWA1 [Hyalella azteca]